MNSGRIVMILAALSLLMSARRAPAGQTDPLRCEAKHLRCEGQLYDCLSRCDRVVARRSENAIAKTSDDFPRCDHACYDRYGAAVDRMKDKPPCAEDIEPADPGQCEAQVLRADAAAMLCQSRCAARARRDPDFVQDDCTDDCDDRHNDRVAEIMAGPLCAAGRMPAADTVR